LLHSLLSLNYLQGREKMSKPNVDRKASESKTSACETTSSPCLFEGTFVSIAGSRIEVEDQHHKKASYALASDALLTCDGKVSKEGALKAGKKIRVTTQKGNPNMVTGIEWLNSNSSFPTPKTAVK
jgi:hypothetical protein